jgi:spermidine/putrescine-binding protein
MEKKEKLDKLKKRLEEIKPIVTKGFDSSQELQAYKQNNITIFNEYYEICEEIEKLEWELMTPAEREKEEETIRLMKLKRDGGLLL